MVGGLNSFFLPLTQRAFVLFVRVFKCDDLQQYALSSFLRRHIGALTALDGIWGVRFHPPVAHRCGAMDKKRRWGEGL
jgi:hypothetical protein